MAERARAVQESFENRQTSTAEALETLFQEIEINEKRKKEQAEKGFDGLTFFVYRTLLDAGLTDAEESSKEIKQAFIEHSNWNHSEKDLRELRKMVTFSICAKEKDLDKVIAIVDNLFKLLLEAYKI